MVASIAQLTSAATSVRYYAREGRVPDDEHRLASRWHGKGAARLGLAGPVDAEPFQAVLEGHVPGTDQRLGSRHKGRHRHQPGVDLVFSAPKSVALEALIEGNERVVAAHDHAAREALTLVEERFLETRGYDRATRKRPRIRAGHLVAAMFRHEASRNLDPQIHTHCVIANMTWQESAWRPVDATALRRNRNLIGALYRNILAARLHDLGLVMVATMIGRVPGFEIAGYDQAFLDEFSSRRREILEHLDRLGLPRTPRAVGIAQRVTRQRKQDRDITHLSGEWKERAARLSLQRKNVPRPPNSPWPDLPPLEIVWRTLDDLEARNLVINRADLEATALAHAPGRHAPQAIHDAIARLARDGHLHDTRHPRIDHAFTTPRLDEARSVLAAWATAPQTGTLTLTPHAPESLATVLLHDRQVVRLHHAAGDSPLRSLLESVQHPLVLENSSNSLIVVPHASTIPPLAMAALAREATQQGAAQVVLMTSTGERLSPTLSFMAQAGLETVRTQPDPGLVATARLLHPNNEDPVIEVDHARLADEARDLLGALSPGATAILAATPDLEQEIQHALNEWRDPALIIERSTGPFTLYNADRIHIPDLGMATIEGGAITLDSGDRLDPDDSRLTSLVPAWAHVTKATRSAIIVLDSGDPDGQASFTRRIQSTFDECVILTDNLDDLLGQQSLLQAPYRELTLLEAPAQRQERSPAHRLSLR